MWVLVGIWFLSTAGAWQPVGDRHLQQPPAWTHTDCQRLAQGRLAETFFLFGKRVKATCLWRNAA